MRRDLNEAQKKAVETIQGPVLTIAGPGTGKTEILAARITNILSTTDTKPEEILCLTYTDDGTIAMRERLLQFIGSASYRGQVSTFHGFCSKVIQEQADHFGIAGRSGGRRIGSDADPGSLPADPEPRVRAGVRRSGVRVVSVRKEIGGDEMNTEKRQILASSVAKAGEQLGLPGDELQSILSAGGEGAELIFLQLFTSLGFLTGGATDKALAWFNMPNIGFDGRVPREIIKREFGLFSVASYLCSKIEITRYDV